MLSLLANVLISTAHAADPVPLPTFDGVTYLQWGMNLTEGSNNANAFDLTRVYFGARQELGDHLGARVLIDAGRGTDNAKQWVFVKNAFVEWKDPAPGVKLQAGMVGTGYIGYAEKFWGHRYAAKSFADEYKLLNSADLGIVAQGSHAKGLVDWHLGVLNGEGYGSPEVDATKTFQGRVAVDPLAPGGTMNLVLVGFGSYGTAAPDADPETDGNQQGDATVQYAGALGFKMQYVTVWAEYDGKSVGDVSTSGYSATLMPTIPKVVDVYGRYDHFDPDADTEDGAIDRIVVGVSHDFYKKVSLAVQYDRAMPEATPDTPSHGVYLKAQAGF